MSDNQPTILVKKADGTFVRVPLSDLKKKSETKITPQTLVKSDDQQEVSITLSKDKKKEKEQITKQKPDDFKSLLEEENEIILSELAPKVSVSRDEDVDMVIKSLSFSVPGSFIGRLRTIIQLRLKDVRGEQETREIVLRSIKDGGLGLTASQAAELEEKCLAQMAKSKEDGVVPLKTKTAVTVKASNDLPQKTTPPLTPTNSTPFNAFIHEEHTIEGSISKTKSVEEFKISSVKNTKPAINDITVKPLTVGPIDEIRFFRLLDFRRLAYNPVESANRLKQKFINLKEESIILFWEAISAWRESPLYQEYVSMLDSAFFQNSNLEAVLVDKEKINLEEITALVNMEKELGI